MSEKEPIWLNKFISESGICSRRDADKFIEAGQVMINKEIGQKGDAVFPGDKVYLNGKLIQPRIKDDLIFIALNKPVGIVSTSENVRDNIVKFVNHPSRIFPIGRLDKDSQGLIFLTNDGDIVNKILRAGNNHEKEYVVFVDKPLTDEAIHGMGNGVPIMGTTTKKCKVIKEGVKSFRIVLVQGMNRQIRRMCEYFGYEVTKLERVRIMNISLKGIPLGEWRDLTKEELLKIDDLTKESSSENFEKPARKKFDPKVKTFKAKTSSARSEDTRKSTSAKSEDFKKSGPKNSSESKSGPPKSSSSKSAKPPSGKRIGKSRPSKFEKPTHNRNKRGRNL
ncbi:MAG: 23S rRNA pseudouridine(2604) synthase RluF [Saprospiraceae bacterium]